MLLKGVIKNIVKMALGLSGMMTLAEAVLQQRFALSKRWDLPDQKLKGGEAFGMLEEYRHGTPLLTRQVVDAPVFYAPKNAILKRTAVYLQRDPWLVRERIEEAKNEDYVAWQVAKNVVGMRYAVDMQIKRWPFWERAIDEAKLRKSARDLIN